MVGTKFVKGKKIAETAEKAFSGKPGVVNKPAAIAPEKKVLARPAPASDADVQGFGEGIPKPAPKVTAMSRTLELVREKKYTDKEIDSIIAKEFPDRKVGAPTWTSRTYLRDKEGLNIPAYRRDTNGKLVEYGANK